MAFNRARVAAHRNPTLASRLAKIAGVDVEELPSPVHIADMMYSRLCRDEELPCWGSKCLDRRTAVALLHEADWEYHTRCVHFGCLPEALRRLSSPLDSSPLSGSITGLWVKAPCRWWDVSFKVPRGEYARVSQQSHVQVLLTTRRWIVVLTVGTTVGASLGQTARCSSSAQCMTSPLLRC